MSWRLSGAEEIDGNTVRERRAIGKRGKEEKRVRRKRRVREKSATRKWGTERIIEPE